MPAPTQVTVSVDKTEYSRYETDFNTVTATVVVQGGAIYAAEEITVDLVKARRSRDAVVASATLEFNGVADPQEGVVTFYLPDLVDQDLIHLARHGDYFVRATSVTDTDILGESDDFKLRVVTVERLKNEYLFGISLAATEIKAPKIQPNIPGLFITEVSASHPLGFGVLQYNYNSDDTANATSAIGAGTDGTVNITADGSLAGSAGNAVAVEVLAPVVDQPLSVGFAGGVLTVNLAISGGVPDNAANTATLVASAIDVLADFTATASGTGVDPLTVAEGPNFFTGGLTVITRQISWNGGPLVSVLASGTYILPKGETGPKACLVGGYGAAGGLGRDYICVRVSSTALLPTENVTEQILIDKKKLDDDALCKFIDKSVDWVENIVIAGYVEPTNVVSDRDPTTIQYAAGVNAPTPIFTDSDYDFITTPFTYFVPRTSGQWVNIQTIFPQVLRVDSLYGAIANTRVIDVDLEWIEVTQQGGMLQLVPFNQEIAFDFIGLLWVNAIRGAAELPNFWHYNLIAGLRECPGELCELIAKKAAIDALTVAGMALRPGVGSAAISRDGVSESVSYTTSAQYGIYTGTIQAYKDWMKEVIPQIKGKYRGPTMIVV